MLPFTNDKDQANNLLLNFFRLRNESHLNSSKASRLAIEASLISNTFFGSFLAGEKMSETEKYKQRLAEALKPKPDPGVPGKGDGVFEDSRDSPLAAIFGGTKPSDNVSSENLFGIFLAESHLEGKLDKAKLELQDAKTNLDNAAAGLEAAQQALNALAANAAAADREAAQLRLDTAQTEHDSAIERFDQAESDLEKTKARYEAIEKRFEEILSI